jgi:HPt (histidine-containing phosphotransfer) domain-containing protein
MELPDDVIAAAREAEVPRELVDVDIDWHQQALGGHLPIVALTGHAMASELNRCREAGMDDCISKPVHPDELFRTLRKWCAPADPAGAEAAPGAREAARSAPRPAVLDEEQLSRVAGDDAAFERQLRDDFIASLPPLLAEAESALGASDGTRLRALAHRLKGSSLTLGGNAVGEACEALEKAAERSGLEGSAVALQKLRSELARLEDALQGRDRKAA